MFSFSWNLTYKLEVTATSYFLEFRDGIACKVLGHVRAAAESSSRVRGRALRTGEARGGAYGSLSRDCRAQRPHNNCTVHKHDWSLTLRKQTRLQLWEDVSMEVSLKPCKASSTFSSHSFKQFYGCKAPPALSRCSPSLGVRSRKRYFKCLAAEAEKGQPLPNARNRLCLGP